MLRLSQRLTKVARRMAHNIPLHNDSTGQTPKLKSLTRLTVTCSPLFVLRFRHYPWCWGAISQNSDIPPHSHSGAYTGLAHHSEGTEWSLKDCSSLPSCRRRSRAFCRCDFLDFGYKSCSTTSEVEGLGSPLCLHHVSGPIEAAYHAQDRGMQS